MRDLYTGAAGQALVMSEFLMRGYNVAIPEVDRGDDLFVVEDSNGDLRRVQVKTANAKSGADGKLTAQFSVPYAQLMSPANPLLYYVFATRYADRWMDLIVLPQTRLSFEYATEDVGTLSDGKVILRVTIGEKRVTCGRRRSDGKNQEPADFSRYRSDFSHWPKIEH